MGRYRPQKSGTPLRNCNEGDQTRDVARTSGIAATASSYAPVLTPRRPSSPHWQRFYVAIAGIPGLPSLAWRLVPKRRGVLRQAMRVVRCAFDYFNRTGSLPAAVFDRDAVTNQAAEVLGTVGTFRGHEGWLELMGEVHEAFDTVRLEPVRLVGVPPDRMVVFVRLSARGR